MYSLYTLIKFIHIAAAIAWIGGAITFALLNANAVRNRDKDATLVLLRQGAFFGQRVMGPSAMTTLIAGIVMVLMSEFGFGELWITWGFVAIFGSIILGAVVMRRVQMEFAKQMNSKDLNDPQVRSLAARLSRLNAVAILLMLSAVWAMVFKPVI